MSAATTSDGRLVRQGDGMELATWVQVPGGWMLRAADRSIPTDYVAEHEGWAIDPDVIEVMESGPDVVCFGFMETFYGEPWYASARGIRKACLNVKHGGRDLIVLPRRFWSREFDFGQAGDFVHLHVHSEFSFLDGAQTIEAIAQRARRAGSSAIAVTDHGVLTGCLPLKQALKDTGVKPIFGTEAYLVADVDEHRASKGKTDRYHLLLIAANAEGWRNLVRLGNLAHSASGFYNKPLTDWAALQAHSAGLICTTACIGGPVCRPLVRRGITGAFDPDENLAWQNLDRLASIFGDRLYVEVQPTDMDEVRHVNPTLIHWANHKGLPIVATCDAHYCGKGDKDIHRIVLASRRGGKLASEAGYHGDTYYLAGRAEVAKMFAAYQPGVSPVDAERAIAETGRLAARVQEFKIDDSVKIPAVEGSAALPEIAREGLAELQKIHRFDPKPYSARLEHEIAVLVELKLLDYFKIIHEVALYCGRVGIKMGSRGSAAGSMFMWCLGITEVDPIACDLLFERFINVGRMRSGGMPDVDVDFPANRRDEVFQFLASRFNVAKISTFTRLQPKAVIHEVARVLGLSGRTPKELADKVQTHGGAQIASLDANVRMSKEFAVSAGNRADEEVLVRYGRRLEGICKTFGQHPAGLIVWDKPLDDFWPMLRQGDDGIRAVQTEMSIVDKYGFVKMDVLGSKNQQVVSKCEEMTGVDRRSIPLDDKEVIRRFADGDAATIAQFNSAQMKEQLLTTNPTSFEDLVALNALIRPGAMDFLPEFASRNFVPPLASAVPILASTRGILLYQEQAMKIAQECAGFDLVAADDLRRAIGKKKREEMNRLGDQFVEGCVAKGSPRSDAEAMWGITVKSASYSFNRSHAYVYTLVGYCEMWFRVHYPPAYFVAEFSANADKKDTLGKYVRDAGKHKVQILPPHVNYSEADFVLSDNAIRFGLASVKRVGAAAAEGIVKERALQGPYASLADLRARVPKKLANSAALEALVAAGAFDGIIPSRWAATAELVSGKARGKKTREEMAAEVNAHRAGWNAAEVCRREYGALGFYLRNDPLRMYEGEMAKRGTIKVSQIRGRQGLFTVVGVVDAIKTGGTGAGLDMGRVTIGDETGSEELILWPDFWQKFGRLFAEGAVVAVTTRIDKKGRFALNGDGAFVAQLFNPGEVRAAVPV